MFVKQVDWRAERSWYRPHLHVRTNNKKIYTKVGADQLDNGLECENVTVTEDIRYLPTIKR